MKIAIVCDVLGQENNGTTIAAMNLVREMKKRGHEVTIVCSDTDKKDLDGYVIMPHLSLGPLNNYVKKNGVTLSRANKKVLEPVLIQSDVVHIMMPFMLGNAAVKLCKKNDIPVTAGFHVQAENFSTHIHMKDNSLANHITYRKFYKSLYRHVDGIHYPTEFIRDLFEQAIGVKTKGYVISNGVDERFKPLHSKKPHKFKDKYVILFTGRYSKEKCHRVLIDAAALSAHTRDIQLIFAGDGPLKKELKKHSEKLANQPVFSFFPHDQMLRVLNFADLYVHPSEIEIEAISCMEAIACGQVPIISDSPRSATGRFALDDRNLFKNLDAQDLADKIDFFIENPDVLEEYRERYKGMVDDFSQKTCMDKMEQMFFDVTE